MYETPIYQHVQRAPLWQCVVGYGAGLATMAVACVAAATGDWPVAAIIGGVAVAFVALMRQATEMHIDVTSSFVRLYYGTGLMSVRIPRVQICNVDVASPTVWRLLRVGANPLSRRLWSFDYGPVVALDVGDTRPYCIGTNDSDGLMNALRAR